MKILLTTEFYEPAINGVVISTLILQSGLQKLGHEVRVLTLSDNGRSFRQGNVTYISSVGAGKVYPEARVALRIRNKLIEELIDWRPDLIHSQSEFSTFIIARRISKKLNIPIIHTYHTLYEEYTHYFSPSKKLGKAVVARLTKRVLNGTQFVIAPTDKVKNRLTSYGVGQKILVVPSGIDLHKFDGPRDEIKLQQLRQKLGIPEGHKVVITVGRLAKEKNIEEIISFMDRLNDLSIALLVVGDGPYRASLEHLALKTSVAKRIIFTGMIAPEEVADYYKLGDVFVSASSSETQGLTYMEALAAGVPVLCKKDRCLDNVIADGVNGWQYSSCEEFSDRLYVMLYQDKLRKELSENARNAAIRHYSSAAFAGRISKIYEESVRYHDPAFLKAGGIQ